MQNEQPMVREGFYEFWAYSNIVYCLRMFSALAKLECKVSRRKMLNFSMIWWVKMILKGCIYTLVESLLILQSMKLTQSSNSSSSSAAIIYCFHSLSRYLYSGWYPQYWSKSMFNCSTEIRLYFCSSSELEPSRFSAFM